MELSVFSNIALTAVSTVVPPDERSWEDELHYYESPEQARQFAESSGFAARRVAAPSVTASDLAIQAAQALFEQTRVDPRSIDALLFVSHSPDYRLPPSAVLQHHALGLSPHCVSLDMNVGCTGFVSALWLGASLIASGGCRRFLLLTGDTPNRFLDRDNRVVAPVFGDAASAALLEYKEGAREMSFLLGTDGGKFSSLLIPGGGCRIPAQREDTPDSPFNAVVKDKKGVPWNMGDYAQIWMSGVDIYFFSLSVVAPHIRRHFALAGLAASDADYLLLHPANKIIVDAIAARLDAPREKAPFEALSRFGNTGSASIPLLMCDALPAAAGVPNSARSMLCGFGAGLSWASCLCSLEDCRIVPVRDYREDKTAAGRNEYIRYWHDKFSRSG